MAQIWKSLRVYLALLVYLSLVRMIIAFVPVRFPLPDQRAQFTWTFVLALALAGFVGTWLYAKAGFPPMWEVGASISKRIIIPFTVGAVSSIVLIVLDLSLDASSVAARNLGIRSIHMPLPESVLIYPAAAIIVETMLRLIPVSLVVWLISTVLLRGRAHELVFWLTAAIVAVLEPLQQAPLFQGARLLFLLYLPYSYVLSVLQMYFFGTEGFLGSLAQRIGNYAAWHMVWGGALAGTAA